MRYAWAIGFALLLAVLAAAVLTGGALPFDDAIRGAVHRLASGHLTALARLFSFIGESVVWVPAAMLAGAVLWLTTRRKQAMALALAMLGGVVLDNVLKLAVHRIRPEAFFGPVPPTYSFPSGHALFAACFYGALAAIFTREIGSHAGRIAVWTAAILVMLCVGLSRIYLGVHYPTDVLAGYLTGAGWLAILHGARLFHFPRNAASGASDPKLANVP
jgi:undecaprenyl-diphosphatase